jgi:hypothetical protein
MYLARCDKRCTVKIRIDGPDANGLNTCRMISVLDTNVEEVEKVLRPVLEAETRKAAIEKAEK